MPVLTLECPACGNVFRGLVLAGTRPPEIWACSRCGGEQARPVDAAAPAPHPWDGPHGIGMCPCCTPAAPAAAMVQAPPLRGEHATD